jgi:AcrR family transcriptional regulator
MARPKAFDEDTALLRAMELFWAPLAQLTACMGINRQSLYDTYGDKRGLFLKALDRYCGLIGGRLLASLATEAPGLHEIKATIAALIGFLVEFPKPRACLMANGRHWTRVALRFSRPRPSIRPDHRGSRLQCTPPRSLEVRSRPTRER